MNLIEIDLDNHYIIPVPAGEKQAYTEAMAIKNGWQPTVTTKEVKNFTGTQKEMDAFVVKPPDNVRILNRLSDRVLHEETITTDNPVSAFDFGVELVGISTIKKISEAIVDLNTKVLQKAQEKALKDAKDGAQTSLDTAFDGMKSR